jgi:hypothetical protein
LVKKLISGLLRKKEEPGEKNVAEAKAPEDIPDELPPLAEDIAETPEEPKAKEEAAPKEESRKEAQEEEPLEELPPLELEEEKTEETDKEGELPEEIKKAKAAKSKDNKELVEPKVEVKKIESFIDHKAKLQSEVGFFSSLLEHIQKQEGHKDTLLSGDLFSRMSSYWELKKPEIKVGSYVSTEKKLEEELKKKLEELKLLEQKWQIQKLALEEDMRFLHERERGIQSKVEELKRISNELSLFKTVKPEEYFHMYNGVVLKNLHDLIDALEIIDDDTFSHHVNHEKNDFSEWIKQVIKDKNLGENIKKARTRDEMIEILETQPIILEDLSKDYKSQLPPRKYFWLKNGIVIKSLYELLDALKAMDDELFEKHVSEENNDFSVWIKDTLKNEKLAERLSKAKTKKGMIDTLEVFL